MGNSLNLPSSTQGKVYEDIVRILKSDETLDRVVKTWSTWQGDTRADLLDPAFNLCPMVTLNPRIGPDEFLGPSSFQGRLVIHVGVAVAGTNAVDLLDLYQAIRRAIYPMNTNENNDRIRTLIRKRLTDAGAETGEPEFVQSGYGTATDEQNSPMLIGTGQISINCRVIDP